MGTTIAFTIQKGGAGKSTSALYAARVFTSMGYKVLLVDADPQGDVSTVMLGVEPTEENDLVRVIATNRMYRRSLADAAVYVEREGFHVIPTQTDLVNMEFGLHAMPKGRLEVMRRAVEAQTDWDIVILDCPTSFGLLTYNLIMAADHLIVPTRPEPANIRGISGMLGIPGGITYLLSELPTIAETPVPTIAGLIVTMVEATVRHQAGCALLRSGYGEPAVREVYAKNYERLAAKLKSVEFDGLKGMAFPPILGCVPKFNGRAASVELLAAYTDVYTGLVSSGIIPPAGG